MYESSYAIKKEKPQIVSLLFFYKDGFGIK